MSSGWELYKAAKLLTNFKHLKGVSTFLLILEKKATSDKILKQIRAAIASVVGLVYLSSNLQIMVMRVRPIAQPPYMQINVLKGSIKGFYFLVEEIFKTIY